MRASLARGKRSYAKIWAELGCVTCRSRQSGRGRCVQNIKSNGNVPSSSVRLILTTNRGNSLNPSAAGCILIHIFAERMGQEVVHPHFSILALCIPGSY